MRTAPPALLPLLRSQVQGDLLALTYLSPDREFTVSEAAQRVGASVKAVQQEVGRLVEAGLLHDRRHGNNRLIRAATDSPLNGPLTELLALTYGPRPVLTRALAGVPGVRQAFIYGSWAARYRSEGGPPPADVDVLVVGDADADDLDRIARDAERVLHREVNIRRVRPHTFDADPREPFLAAIREQPLVELDVAQVPASAAAARQP